MLPSDDTRIHALDEVLRIWSVPIGTEVPGGHRAGPNLFVLGSLERRVTIFAQQIRALNLIAALEERGGFIGGLQDRRVAVVGAGVAGVTAALAAAGRGASVTVIERNAVPFQNISRSHTRWLHPRIYDWPNPGWDNPVADLPYLPWSAESCAKVARVLGDRWAEAVRDKRVAFRGDATKIEIEREAGGHALVVNNEHLRSFEVVILALGFGAERQLGHHETPSYWEDFNIEGDKVLVVGCGDGGLIDVIRASTENYIQEYLHVLRFTGHEELERVVAEHEFELTQNRIGAHDLPELYRRLPHREALDAILGQAKRLKAKVYVAATQSGLMNPNAAPLHRVLVSRLVACGIVAHIRGSVRSVERYGDRFKTIIDDDGDGREDDFAMVIARLGPQSALGAFSKTIFDAMSEKFPRIGSHRLPPRLWESSAPPVAPAPPSPPSPPPPTRVAPQAQTQFAFGAASGEPIAGSVSRMLTIGNDGIADVVIELTDVRAESGTLLLAAPRGTIGNIDPDPHAVIDGNLIRVEVQGGSHAVRFEIRDVPTSLARVRWGYRVTNAFATNRAETEMFHGREWRSSILRPGWELWSHQLQLKTDRLVLELVYPVPDFCGDALPSVERPVLANGELTWAAALEEEARCAIVKKDQNTLRLLVEHPIQNFRYGFKYELSEPGTPIADATHHVLADAIKLLRNTKAEGAAARDYLTTFLKDAVKTYARCSPDDLDREDIGISVVLWDAVAKKLVPVGGLFQPSSWSSDFPYGVGVAGHSFRFRCPVAWYQGSRERTSVIRTPPRLGHSHDWILCFPIFAAFPDEALGVVSISGNDQSPWFRLRNLARSSMQKEVLESNLQFMYDLNTAFWTMLEAISDSFLEAKSRHERSWPA